MKTLSELELAQKWFSGEGVKTHLDDGSLYVYFDGLEVQVSSAEVAYRADLYKEEK